MTVDDLNYDELDPGVRELVRRARAAGFVTTDSGDGVSKPKVWFDSGDALPFPHVAAKSTPETMVADADRFATLLPIAWTVEASYSTRDKSAILFAMKVLP